MPFDGIVTKCIVNELGETLAGGRVEKIFQPEPDEININIRANSQNYRLLLSASANYPRIHITESTKDNPAVAPVFCMLLRKHLSGGKILGIDFLDFERIITLRIESTNELGDTSVKKLIIEIMGRYSNIILTNQDDKIIDSIKHIDNEISSVREVMPARPYILPPQQNKTSPEKINVNIYIQELSDLAASGISESSISIEKYMLNTIKGFSPILCSDTCYKAGINGKSPVSSLTQDLLDNLKFTLGEVIKAISINKFTPCMILGAGNDSDPIDFHCLEITNKGKVAKYDSISFVLDSFYFSKDNSDRLKVKKSDILKILTNSFERCRKKIAIHQENLREVADRDKLKLYGELITANIYCISQGLSSVSLLNFYNEKGESVDVPMDSHKSPQENAQRYFKKYSKAKTTYDYTNAQLKETLEELEYLESVLHLLDNCSDLREIEEIRQELVEQGYMSSKNKRSYKNRILPNVKASSKKKNNSKKQDKPSPPLHYRSSEGFDIFVGKNNKQNDILTLKTSSSNDMWLHTRNIPGSHVIIKKTQQVISEKALYEAAILAAYHSKAGASSNVPVDYTPVKYVKKPNGAKPGMVIYNEFKTIIVTPDAELVEKLKAD